MAIYLPREKTNYYKVGHLITRQRVSKPTASETDQELGLDDCNDVVSDAPTAMQSDIEKASSDLTGSSGVYSAGHYLKLFSD